MKVEQALFGNHGIGKRLHLCMCRPVFQYSLATLTKALPIVLAIVLLGPCAERARAQSRIQQRECSPERTNGDCTIHIDRESPSRPLPIRVWPTAKVTVNVTKRPLEKINYDVTLTDVPRADPFVAIFLPLLGPLKAITTNTRTTAQNASSTASQQARTPTLEERLLQIQKDQESVRAKLNELQIAVDCVGREIKKLQETRAEKWTVENVRVARKRLIRLIEGTNGNATLYPTACKTIPYVDQPLDGSIEVLRNQVTAAIKELGSLIKPSQDVTDDLNAIVSNQSLIEESFKSLQAAKKELRKIAKTLKTIQVDQLADEKTFLSSARDVDRTATIKVSAKDLLSGSATDLVTIVVTWGSTHFELSTGVLFSALVDRSFKSSPIIVNGHPSTDANGRINTVVTETTTRPMVVPFVFAHYRLVDGAVSGRRLAVLFSGGIGINPYSGSADFGTGLTFSVRNFMLTPVLHFGRDMRLTNGLAVGEELGSNPPNMLSTERYWVRKFGIAISYRLPIP